MGKKDKLIKRLKSRPKDYFVLCHEKGIEPEKAYKGSFNVRMSPELHRQAALCAKSKQISLNSFVEDAVKFFLSMQQ